MALMVQKKIVTPRFNQEMNEKPDKIGSKSINNKIDHQRYYKLKKINKTEGDQALKKKYRPIIIAD